MSSSQRTAEQAVTEALATHPDTTTGRARGRHRRRTFDRRQGTRQA
jgi:hypothetical protein